MAIKQKIVLGIDPGTAILGYGLITQKGNKISYIHAGCIKSDSKTTQSERLIKIADGLFSIIEQYKPDEIAVEEIFFSKNVKTAISVAQARGVVLLTAARASLKLAEYKPNQVKLAVCGYGKAEKKQVQQMVKRLLNMQDIVKSDDAADALAIAICHVHSRQELVIKK